MPRDATAALRQAVLVLAGVMGLALAQPATAQITLRDVLSQLGAQPTRTDTRQGQATQAEGGPTAETAVGQKATTAAAVAPEPFGASLFRGGAPTSSDAVNPNYLLQPGDRIGVGVLGLPNVSTATAGTAGTGAPQADTGAETSVVVDPQGNIFLPQVGPVKVAGTRAGDLQRTVQQATRGAFTANVQFYAVLLTTHRIGVFVTGFVDRPGRYAGSASDSVLDYLVRAGGVDPSRGSYRHIAINRKNKVVAEVDLYEFLLNGKLTPLDLQEGDTIVVGHQGPMVAVDGAVRNNYLFELSSQPGAGRELADLARPLPSATHAVITGSRDNQPFSLYVSLAAFAATPVLDQDRVTVVTDAPASTVRVNIQGSRIGPSVLVLPTDTRLPAVLPQVHVDPKLADVRSVYVLRKSVADQQTRVINEAMDRLERSLYLATSATTGVSQIRASEAQLVAGYIQRARNVHPEGRLVVTDDAGTPADLRLEDDDIIVIPEKSQLVMVSGEVLAPQAVLFQPGLSRADYVKKAGGYSERGRKNGHFLIRRANGSILLDQDDALRPGDELVVLPYIDPKLFQIGSDLLSLIYQAAVAATVIRTF